MKTAMDILEGLIRQSEGCKLTAYWDKYGQCWTIGWGCTGKGIVKGMVWTQQFADTTMRVRANAALRHALRLSPGLESEPPERQAAIADFIYNLGVGNYAASSLKKAVDAKYWAGAEDEINRWIYAGKRPLPGLVARRQREGNLLDED
jgi:lysozyme